MKFENLYKIYNIQNDKIYALNNVSYSFDQKKFYAIKGHSGSGKSTLIQVLGLMIKPTSGKYFINDIDISQLTSSDCDKIRRDTIGFVFQDYYLNNKLTAFENVELPMFINPKINKENRKERTFQLLKMVGLENRVHHYPDDLSGGEAQRVAIARALANSPKYILADEPTGNLDINNEEKVLKILKKIVKSGTTIIVVTHSNEVLKYADIILEMKDGKLEETINEI